MGVERGMLTRLLHVEGAAVIVHVWVRRDGPVVLHAAAAREPAPGHALEVAVERMRFALGLDDDLREFYDAFRGGPSARSRDPAASVAAPAPPGVALGRARVAVTKQLIESPRAAAIQRRIVRRWGPAVGELRDVPDATTIAGVAPAELAGMDLSPSRSVSMIKVAREVAAGRAELTDPEADRRLLTIRASERGLSAASASTGAAIRTRFRRATSDS